MQKHFYNAILTGALLIAVLIAVHQRHMLSRTLDVAERAVSRLEECRAKEVVVRSEVQF